MSDYATNFPPQTYSSSFYINALAEGDKRVLVVTDSEEEENTKDEIKVKNSPILDCFISTMKTCLFIISFAFLTTNIVDTSTSNPPENLNAKNTPSETIECVEEKSSRIRTFANFTDYQGNKYSFDPRHQNYRGNIVQFSFASVDRIVKNTFISFGSDNIMQLDLHGKAIQDIEPESFKGLFCLQKLDLSRNVLSNLTEGSFAGLENLEELNLSSNSLKDIPDDGLTFITLKSIKVLDLSHNNITTLNRRSFMTLYDLEILNICFNNIKTMDPKVFNYMESLQKLYLCDNDLVEITVDQWKGLGNLSDLDLSDNYLSIFDMSDKYTLSNLKNLNLSGNVLKDMNMFNIKKTFPNLSNIDLSDNDWYCQDLEVIKRVLRESKITLTRSIGCSDEGTTSTKPVTKQATTTPISKLQRGIELQLVKQNNHILQSNEAIVENIESLKSVTMCLLIVLVIFGIVGVGFKLGICRSWYYSATGRSNRGYIQTRDCENVGLIPR